jgi:hypothetical protein
MVASAVLRTGWLCLWMLLALRPAPPAYAINEQAAGSVNGAVLDARTGQPIAGARIAIDNTTISVLSTETGRFVLPVVAAGPARLIVSLAGYAFVRREIQVIAGMALELTIPLTEGTRAYTEEVRVTGDLFPREEIGVLNR